MKLTWNSPPLLSLYCFTAAAIFVMVIFNTEPEAQREGATKRGPMLVETVVATLGDHQPIINAVGTVRAEHDITLQARVEGQVIRKHPDFFPGGILAEGTPLVTLDTLDYELALDNARAQLMEAEAALSIAEGERAVAELELAQLTRPVNEKQRSLILKEPEMRIAKAGVMSAKAAVRQAEADLERTQIQTPFLALALDQMTDRGEQLRPGDIVARLVGVEHFWVEAQIPANALEWLKFSEQGSPGSRVEIRDNGAWPSNIWREGTLLSHIGNMDEGTRLARVLIRIDDPLGLQDENLPSLSVGAFVQARIHAKPLENVVKIPRKLLRKNNTVWLNSSGKLAIPEVSVVYRDTEYVYLENGISEGDELIVTDISRIRVGSDVQSLQPTQTAGVAP